MERLLQCSANQVPLTPPSFLQRARLVCGYKTSINFGNTSRTWTQTHERWSNLASARTVLKISGGDIVAPIPSILAGDPDLSATVQALKTLARCGSERIENSVSDPLADSPLIQVVPQLSFPVALFPNFIRILKLGAEKFMSILNDAGVQGQRPPRVYDVFISYKQEDMQPQVSHLKSALELREIKTFVDFTVEEGVEFQRAIDKAIQQSQIAVVIVSPNFHSSPWCLNELVKILECRKKWGLIVLPIFWGTDAKGLREQPSHFVENIGQGEMGFKQENPRQVQRWRDALKALGRIKGWSVSSSSDKTEADVIKDLADKIAAKLSRSV